MERVIARVHKGIRETNAMSTKPQFSLSQRSLNILSTVHPDMQAVVRRAIELTTVDFGVTQGRRTQDEQDRLYGQGRTPDELERVGIPGSYSRMDLPKVTWTRNSNHLSGNAVDLAPYIGSRLEWDNDGRLGLWRPIADAMKQSATELGIKIIWGGDWKSTPDRPHFELA